jgi:hypothetical protein
MMGLSRVLALLVLFCGVVVAQPKPPTPQQKADIDRLAKRAISKSQSGDHEGAIKDLLDAVAIHPASTYVLLTNIGSEYKAMKKPIEALRYFCMYIDKEPTGAAVLYVKAETEVLKKDLKLEGEPCAQKNLEPKQPDPPKPDLTPKDPNPPGGGTNGQVTGTQHVDKGSSSPGRRLKLAGLGVGVVGAAVLAGGVVFGMKAKANSDRITEGPPQVDPTCVDMPGMLCPRIPWDPADPEREWPGYTKLNDDGKAFERNQIIMTVAGGAMIVTGAAMYFLGRSKKSGGETRVSATASPGNAGLVLAGEF